MTRVAHETLNGTVAGAGQMVHVQAETALSDRIGSAEWRDTVRNTLCRGASDAVLTLFAEVCRQTGLNPFARQIYLMERRVKHPDGSWGVTYQPQTSIDGFRVVAHRTKQYAGQLGPYWCGSDGKWVDVWLHVQPPAAAKVAVLRHDFSEPLVAIAKYEEYVQTTRDGHPNSMWAKMPANQLAKCAESLALRKAFPQDLSGLYTAEEMGQAANEAPPATTPTAGTGASAVSRVVDKLRNKVAPKPETIDPPHQDDVPEKREEDEFADFVVWTKACDEEFQRRGWTPERADQLRKSCRAKRGYATAADTPTSFRREFYSKLVVGEFEALKVAKQPAPSAPVETTATEPAEGSDPKPSRAASTRRTKADASSPDGRAS